MYICNDILSKHAMNPISKYVSEQVRYINSNIITSKLPVSASSTKNQNMEIDIWIWKNFHDYQVRSASCVSLADLYVCRYHHWFIIVVINNNFRGIDTLLRLMGVLYWRIYCDYKDKLHNYVLKSRSLLFQMNLLWCPKCHLDVITEHTGYKGN